MRDDQNRIADLTDKIRRRPMGELFEHWDSEPDEELREQGRAEERKNTEAESRADAEQQRADVAENRAEKAESREDAVEVESAKLREEIARLKATRG